MLGRLLSSHVSLLGPPDLGGESKALLMRQMTILSLLVFGISIRQIKVEHVNIGLCLLRLLLVFSDVKLTCGCLPGQLIRSLLLAR